jgi:glycosyltransferase involved in cell wall biosynthesis/acetyltransferase-like isoleucine patch superfamily enzyme
MRTPDSNRPDNRKTLFFIALPRHDARYTSTPWQIATQLAENNNVIYADHPYTFLDLILHFRNPAVRKRLKSYLGNYTFRREGVHVILSPFVWPVNFLPKGKLYGFFSRLNHRIMARRINSALHDLGCTSITYINSFNFYFSSLHSFIRADKQVNIYHCIDPMIKPFTLKHGPYLQERAARWADITISTAPALQKSLIDKGFTESYLVPNAANYTLFSTAAKEIPVHPKVASIKGKVMGYFGNIERRTNFKLLLDTLNTLQEWHLVMAGPADREYVPVEMFVHPRVHFTGSFSLEEAPSVLKRFDVALIPFVCDEVSAGIFPLKLYEYLAAGKPVVTTNFNPDILTDLQSVIHIADSTAAFSNAVLFAYATDSPQKIAIRQELASHHTWKDRAQQFERLIQQQLEKKNIQVEPTILNHTRPSSLKERIKSNPALKKFILSLIFRKKPYGSRVKWYIWLWLIFPKYFKRGISWNSRLDLTPFNRFKLGKFSRIEQGVVINNGMGDVVIHDEVHTGIGCILIGPITLHKHVGLSQYVRILGMHHGSDADSPHHYQRAWKAPVILEEDAFIGTGTVIMGKKNGEPLVLGRYCRVGANSVVTTDIPAYSVAVGNPAKVVRVWDFTKKCWVKPAGTGTRDKAEEKITLDPSVLRNPEVA